MTHHGRCDALSEPEGHAFSEVWGAGRISRLTALNFWGLMVRKQKVLEVYDVISMKMAMTMAMSHEENGPGPTRAGAHGVVVPLREVVYSVASLGMP